MTARAILCWLAIGSILTLLAPLAAEAGQQLADEEMLALRGGCPTGACKYDTTCDDKLCYGSPCRFCDGDTSPIPKCELDHQDPPPTPPRTCNSEFAPMCYDEGAVVKTGGVCIDNICNLAASTAQTCNGFIPDTQPPQPMPEAQKATDNSSQCP